MPPDSALSFSRFMTSFAQGLMLGLLRSAIRYVGWAPLARNSLLETYRWAGSLRVGLGSPGMAMKSPRPKTHAASLEEKSGIDAPCSAASLASDPVQIHAVNTPIARTLIRELKSGISMLPGAIRRPAKAIRNRRLDLSNASPRLQPVRHASSGVIATAKLHGRARASAPH